MLLGSSNVQAPRPAGHSSQRTGASFGRCVANSRAPGVRRQHVISHAADDMQQFFSSRDKAANAQLSSLKSAAQDFMDAVLKQQREKAAAGGSGGGPSEIDTKQLRRKIEHAIKVMQEGLVERDTEVRLLVLAALSGEHVLFIGPPGTAKSEVGRRLSALIEGSYFERLLTRFSVPEELFGPLSMRALEEDKYVRQTRGYLPEANVAFIDEVFKANSAILNTLLTILNERQFDNGTARLRVPLVTLVGASNELPESEELDALYDRFLVRKKVGQVSAAGLTQLLDYYAGNDGDGSDRAASPAVRAASGSGAAGAAVTIDPRLKLSLREIQSVRSEAVKRVKVPQHVIQLVADLRTYLQEKIEPPVYVSDRRLVKAVALMQVAAYCNGRDAVTEYDCLLLEHVLWNTPEVAPKIADWLLAQLAVDDGMKQVDYLLSGIFSRACKVLGGSADKVADIAAEAGQLRGLLADKLLQVLVNLEGGFPSLHGNLWLGSGEGDAVATALVPKLNKTRDAVEKLLFEVATLEVALKAGTDAVTLANLMPSRWANFIRNSPMEEVKPLGTTTRI